MDTAVVILNWNGLQWLEQFLPGVVALTAKDARVIVADNGSTDGSVAWVRANVPDAEVIGMPENQGFAGGYNTALAQVDATYFVLLNSDVEVTPGWVGTLRAHLDARPDMAACQPKMLSHRNRTTFEHAGAAAGQPHAASRAAPRAAPAAGPTAAAGQPHAAAAASRRDAGHQPMSHEVFEL